MKTLIFSFLSVTASADALYTPADLATAVQAGSAELPADAELLNVKVWRALGNLELAYTFSNYDPVYVMCHFHDGEELDCHRRSRPGPHEP